MTSSDPPAATASAVRGLPSAVSAPPSRIPAPGTHWNIESFNDIISAIHCSATSSWSAVRAATASIPLPTPATAAPTSATAIVGDTAITRKPTPSAPAPSTISCRDGSSRQRAYTAAPATAPPPQADSSPP